MKSLKEIISESINESSANEVPVRAFFEFLRDANIEMIQDGNEGEEERWQELLQKKYKVSADIATALVSTMADATREVKEVDASLFKDLFHGDKLLKKETNFEYYIAATVPGEKKAYVASIFDSQRKNLKAVLDNIKWSKGGKYDVYFNF